jgi:hypothetical protein
MESRTNAFGWPRWLWRCALILVFIPALVSLPVTLTKLARGAGLIDPGPSLGLSVSGTSSLPSGWGKVTAVEVAGAAAAAGIAPGDQIRFDRQIDRLIVPHRGGDVPLTVLRGTRQMRVTMKLAASGTWSNYQRMNAIFASGFELLWCVFGVILMTKGRQKRPAVILGFYFLSYGSIGDPPFWWPDQSAALAALIVTQIPRVLIGYLLLLFCLEVSAPHAGKLQRRWVHAAGIASTIVSIVANYSVFLFVPLPLFGTGNRLFSELIVIRLLLGFVIIGLNYRLNDAPSRNRIKIVMAALVFVAIAVEIALVEQGPWSQLLFYIRNLLLAASAALLSYATLHQRLFDIDFAINRTLVYGAVSFTMLAGFGLAEWGVEHVLPESWHQGGVFASAGIALALFLSFHRLRDWVEHQIERFFFRSWHENEAALKRFVAAAAHYDHAPALCRAFAEELRRFTAAADGALYLRSANGSYDFKAGCMAGAQPGYAADDHAFALMRSERRPVEIAAASSALPGALALPMLDQGRLGGFVLLGPKPQGTNYRPDEIDALGWAVHQVGLDLQAIHARELEAEVTLLRQKLAIRGERKRRSEAPRLAALPGGAA